MDPNDKVTSGANASASGDVETPEVTSETVTSGDVKEGNYPAHFVDKLKKEKDNQIRKVNDLTTELSELRAKVEQSQTKGLEDKEQFRTLWEQEKEKASGFQQQLDSLNVQIVDAKKKSAVKKHLLDLGLQPRHEDKAFRLMDISGVFVDDETGAVIGAEETAKAFHTDNHDLGIFGKPTPGVSHQAPEVGKQVRAGAIDPNLTKDQIMAKLRELESQGV